MQKGKSLGKPVEPLSGKELHQFVLDSIEKGKVIRGLLQEALNLAGK